jgi:superfamily II DNA or RNA helicase
MTTMTLPLEMPGTSGSPIRPRDYQDEGITSVLAAPARGINRPLLVLPTGGGKTVCFAHVVHRRPGRALVMAHRDELIGQAAAKLDMVAGGSLDIGIVKAQRDEAGAPCVVGSVQTLARPGRVDRLLRAGPFATVVVDEAHHAVADSYLKILDQLGCLADTGGPLTMGCTATAGRTDNIGLGHVWQEIICPRGLIQMIAEGWLVDVHGQEVGTDFDLGNLTTRRGDFTDGSIEAELERSDAIDAAVRAWKRYAPDRLTVAFTPTVATAYATAEAFEAAGIPAAAIDGTTDPDVRRDRLAALERGEIRVLANCAVLTEGWDCPQVSCCIMMRPTKSQPFFIQMVGRILRPYLGKLGGQPYEKSDALVLDVTGQAAVLGLATLADLAGLKPGSVKPGQSLAEAAEEQGAIERRRVAVGAARTRQVNLLSRSELHWVDVDGAGWVLPAGKGARMLLVPAPGADELADQWIVWHDERGTPRQVSKSPMTLDWARGVGEEVARMAPEFSRRDAGWRTRPASDAQLGLLRKLKVKAPAGVTRGDASDLADAHFARRTIRKLTGAR